jgi:hypothetical protein
VSRHRQAFSSFFLYLFRYYFQIGEFPAGNGHIGTRLSQSYRCCLTNPPAGSGDEDNFTLQ